MLTFKTKYNVIYEDKYGAYNTVLLSCPPSQQTRRELGIVNIIDIEDVKIVVNNTNPRCRDMHIYENPNKK